MQCADAAPAARRFFLPGARWPAPLPGPVTVSDPSVLTHWIKVLRLSVGTPVVLVAPETQQAFTGTLTALSKQGATVQLTAVRSADPATRLPPITVGAALIKEHRWEWLLQKATELGAHTLAPLVTARTVIKVHDPAKKQARWQAIVQAAAEQSEGWYLPTVTEPVPLAPWLIAQQETPGLKFLLLERGADRPSLITAVSEQSEAARQGVTLAIGPEGGWTAEEVAQLTAGGFQPVSLGARILRSETAALTALGVLNCIYDSLR